jgi:hypothetical protein
VPHLDQPRADRIRIRPALNRGRRLLNEGAAVDGRRAAIAGER